MEYRTLRNGQKISTIGIGVGNYGYENISCAEVEKIFHTAFDQGVNFLDTCMSVSSLQGLSRVSEASWSCRTTCAWAIQRASISTC